MKICYETPSCRVGSIVDYGYCCNTVMINHNSLGLQDKLKKLGYCELGWTTNGERKQKLVAQATEHTKHIRGSYYGDKDKEIFQGCFWNAGVAPIERPDEVGPRGNMIYVANDEEMFINYATRLMTEREIYFDKDKKEIVK